MVLTFSDKTKASLTNPYRPDMLVLIEDEAVANFRLWLSKRNSRAPITVTTTQQLTQNIRQILHSSHSAHSIKRGALNFLAEVASQGTLDPSIIPLIAKHRVPSSIPDTTVRYITNKPALARFLGTQHATKQL
eukprot:PhM_4_TR18876/c1_g1_i2/m.48219